MNEIDEQIKQFIEMRNLARKLYKTLVRLEKIMPHTERCFKIFDEMKVTERLHTNPAASAELQRIEGMKTNLLSTNEKFGKSFTSPLEELTGLNSDEFNAMTGLNSDETRMWEMWKKLAGAVGSLGKETTNGERLEKMREQAAAFTKVVKELIAITKACRKFVKRWEI